MVGVCIWAAGSVREGESSDGTGSVVVGMVEWCDIESLVGGDRLYGLRGGIEGFVKGCEVYPKKRGPKMWRSKFESKMNIFDRLN